MGYTNTGKLWVPDAYQGFRTPQADAADVALGGLYNDSLDELAKSLFGATSTRKPHQLLPWNSINGLYNGVRDPEGATFRTVEFLRRMSGTTILRDVIDSIVALVLTYCIPAQGPTEPGWRITTRDRNTKPSPQDKVNMAEIAEIIAAGGVRTERKSDGAMGVWDKEQEEEADPFPVLVQKMARDSLTIDWAAARTEPGGNDRKTPVAFIKALDAGRVRLVEQQRRTVNAVGDFQEVHYEPVFRKRLRVEAVELWDDNTVVNEYPWSEVITWVRNQRTDICATGYGWPELASCVELAAGLTTAIDHNVKYFTHNRIPPCIITATGAFDETMLQDFLWTMMQPGQDGTQWYKLPLLFSPNADSKLNVVPFRQQEKMDMFWRNWLTFLIAAICAAFRVATEELNFQAFLTQGGQQTGTGGAERVATMRSTGVRSFLTALEHLINHRWVGRCHADSTGVGPYRFEFQNLVPRDEAEERQSQQADFQTGLVSVNMVRARRDQRPWKDPKDTAKFRKVQQAVREEMPDLERTDEDFFIDLCEYLYEQRDGEWALWPDAPGGGLVQGVWQQEHEQELAPPQDDGQQWLDAQQGGPPQNFQDDMARTQFKAEQGQLGGPAGQQPGMGPGQPQGVQPGADVAPPEAEQTVRKGVRVYEVTRRG